QGPTATHLFSDPGLYYVDLRVTDNQGASSTRSIPINVTSGGGQRGPNTPPAAASDAWTTPEDTPLKVNAPGVLANDSDANGDHLTAALVSGPGHGTLNLAPDGSFTYTPAANFNGADSFTYKANDGLADITPVNDPPVSVGDTWTTAEDTPLVVHRPGVLANDSDVDGDQLTAALVSGPAHGSLNLAPDGSFTYTPAANFNGTDSFTYKPNDGTADGPAATVTLHVTAVNDPPVAAPDSYGVHTNQTLNVSLPGVLGNDTDVDGDHLTAALVSGPHHGTLSLAADGSFSYKPVAGFNGTDVFTYEAYDGKAVSNGALVAINVSSEARGLPTVNVRDAAPVQEPTGHTAAYADFAVDLTAASRSAVVVKVATKDGTAKGGRDYQRVDSELRFQPGETHKVVRVLVMSDRAVEAPEDFYLLVRQVSGAQIGDGLAKAVIAPAPVPALVVDDAPVVKAPAGRGAVYAVFVVELSTPSASPVTVNVDTEDGTAVAMHDYRAVHKQLRFAPGETRKIVRVRVLGPGTGPGDADFFLIISHARGAQIADSAGVATIRP